MADNKAVAETSKADKNEVIYQAGGEDVRLSPSIVRNLLNQDTKNLTDAEVFKFIQLCRFRKLNPFLNEAYLVKFGSEKAQMIVGFEAMRRNALGNPNYKRHEAGVIVLRENKIVEEIGSFKLPKDTLVGGWAKVYLTNLEEPLVVKVSFDEYNKGQSTWKKMPCVMIRKVALSQAFREAFPNDCGAMYSEEEMTPTKEESIKSTIEEIKQEIQEEPKETLNMPFDEEPIDAEIIEDEKIDF